MLYYFFDYLEQLHVPGMGVFQYISFRTAAATILSLLISLVFGKRLILVLSQRQIGETIRNLGIKDEQKKSGTPTMGGLIIIAAIIIPTLLFARLSNIYIIMMLCTTVWLGMVGFLDDYIKVFKKNKEGLSGRYKVIAQLLLGIAIGATMFWHPSIVTRSRVDAEKASAEVINDNTYEAVMGKDGEVNYYVKDEKSV